MNRLRRLPVILFTCLTAACMAFPLSAAAAVVGWQFSAPTEEKGEESRGEQKGADETSAAPSASAHRSHRARRDRVLPPPSASPSPPSLPVTRSPRADSGHTLRNGLGTFYRC